MFFLAFEQDATAETFSNAMMLRIRLLSLYSFGRVAVTVTPQLRNVRHD